MIPGGIVTRRELHAAGLGDGAIWSALVDGRLVRVGRAQYTAPGAPSPIEVVLAREGRGALLSHASAARLRGLPTDDPCCHITIPNGSRRRWVPPGVVVHQTKVWESEIVDGFAVTPLDRTLADIAATSSFEDAVQVLDAGLRIGADRGEVRARLGEQRPGAARGRRALDAADPSAESPLESRLRLVLVDGGVAPDETQHEIVENGIVVARADFWFTGPDVDVEADGFEFHSERSRYRRDRRRMQAVARHGALYLPFSWEDVTLTPAYTVQTVGEVTGRRALRTG